MSTLRDSYSPGTPNNYADIYGANWRATNFTAGSSYSMTAAGLWLYKVGSPAGTVTVHLRATDVTGKPTGSDLASGTIAVSSIATTPGDIYEVTFGTPYDVSSGTKYAIVVNWDGSDVVTILFRYDSPVSGPPRIDSADSGSTWGTPSTTVGVYFSTWGNDLTTTSTTTSITTTTSTSSSTTTTSTSSSTT